MSEMYLYFRQGKPDETIGDSYEVKYHRISRGLFLPNETKSLKTAVRRLYFLVLSFGRAVIAYVCDDQTNQVIHTSYMLPRSFKFPFLTKGDLEIGPCITVKNYRRKGIYTAVLRNILRTGNGAFYMLVGKNNTASIRGIEKAGFRKVGICTKTRFLKLYIVKERFDEHQGDASARV